jgi:hypothetical protein
LVVDRWPTEIGAKGELRRPELTRDPRGQLSGVNGGSPLGGA